MSEPIGVEVDTLSDFYLLQAMQGQISKNIRHFENISKAADALKAGELSGIMGPRGELEGVLAERPANIQIQSLITPGLARNSWAMGIAVKADNAELANALNNSMADLVRDGTVKHIFEQYKVGYNPPAEPPEALKPPAPTTPPVITSPIPTQPPTQAQPLAK